MVHISLMVKILDPVEPIQDPIIQSWNNSNSLLKELLRDEVGLQLQPLDSGSLLL